MATIIIVGTQWGDEGKGKIVDILSEHVDIIARFQGGHNAGHTVYQNKQKYILHSIPTGILHPNKTCIIGNGVVIDPNAFIQEVEALKKLGVKIAPENLRISKRAHLIMPYNCTFDLEREKKKGKNKIGTTGRGIGPAYEDKMARVGMCIGDLLYEDTLSKSIKNALPEKNNLLKNYFETQEISPETLLEECKKYGDILKDYLADTSVLLNKAMIEGKDILCEGAQGTMLDIDHGTYPFVTSSNCIAGQACIELGFGPNKIDGILGVTKAYTTRVGNGPFPTELTDDIGKSIQTQGKEFGATTGRPRRCGWFDAVVLRYAIRVNGLQTLALTKMDVLDHLDTIKVCTGYKWKGETFHDFPYEAKILKECTPIYKKISGWQKPIQGTKQYEDLPRETKDYVKFLQDTLEIDISIVSTGFERKETIFINNSLLDQWLKLSNSLVD